MQTLSWKPHWKLVTCIQVSTHETWSLSSLEKGKIWCFCKICIIREDLNNEKFLRLSRPDPWISETKKLMLIRRVVTGSAPLASPTQAAILVAALALSPSFLAFFIVELIIQVTLSFLHCLTPSHLSFQFTHFSFTRLKLPFSPPSSWLSTTYTGHTTGAPFSYGLV